MMEKSFKSAIVIAPPIAFCKQIQDIREKHDRAFHRWMPHINLVYPFYEEQGTVFDREAQKLTMQLSKLKPFKITFNKDSLGFFRRAANTVVWIRPLLVSASGPGASLTMPKPQLVKARKSPKPVKTAPKSKIVQKSSKPTTKKVQWETFAPTKAAPANTMCNTKPTTASAICKTSEIGFDALSDAIWKPEDTQREIMAAKESSTHGLDALRFAICGLSPEVQRKSNKFATSWEIPDTKTVPAVQTGPKDNWDCDHGTWNCSSESSEPSSDESSESEESVEEEMDQPGHFDTTQMLAPRADGQHPSVMMLQELLEATYPDLNDLSTRSEEGFQPHLTLGQFKNSKAHTFITELKNNFKEFTFEVNSIDIISRYGQFDKFTVKSTVPLGAVYVE